MTSPAVTPRPHWAKTVKVATSDYKELDVANDVSGGDAAATLDKSVGETDL